MMNTIELPIVIVRATCLLVMTCLIVSDPYKPPFWKTLLATLCSIIIIGI